METPLQDVSVKVPTDRVADFYEMYGRWLRGGRLGGAAVEIVDGDLGTQRLPWDTARDLDLARAAWSQFPDRAKQLFGTLIDHPNTKYSGDELADMHSIPNGKYGVAGVLAHPGRQLKKLGRQNHFHAEPLPEGGSSYWMDNDMADLFRQAKGL